MLGGVPARLSPPVDPPWIPGATRGQSQDPGALNWPPVSSQELGFINPGLGKKEKKMEQITFRPIISFLKENHNALPKPMWSLGLSFQLTLLSWKCGSVDKPLS